MKYTVWHGLEGDLRNSNYNIRRTVYYNKPGFSQLIAVDANGFRIELYPKDTNGDGKKDENDAVNPDAAYTTTVRTGDRIISYEADSLEVLYPYCTKWGGYDPSDDFGYAIVKDWPIMRLGETYLLRAEARFRQNNTSGTAADINKLRDRAFKVARATTGNATLGNVNASDITIDFILDERARELIGEENRRMTLVRSGKLANRVPMNGDTSPVGKVITGFDANKHILLPIPLSEMQMNKDAELKQNPGYN